MKSVSIFLTIFLFISTAFATDGIYVKNHMTPLMSEKLSNPINLTGLCNNVQISEWRSTVGEKNSFSVKTQIILNNICELAVKNFSNFIKTKKNYLLIKKDFTQFISIIPADIQKHGSDVRNLNDINYRFFDRSKEYDVDGNIIPIWGYHQRSTSYIYIRNDILDKSFKTIFAHELFHAMSYQFGIFQQHVGDKNVIDETMARQFTKFLQLGE